MTKKEAIEFYGLDAKEWLRRWDAGRGCWSIEMGGLGPGYEQAIQVTAAEIIRAMLDAGYDYKAWKDPKAWEKDRDAIEASVFANDKIKGLGLSGAQWGAAMNLACHMYMSGPYAIMNDKRVEDRKIQVSKNWPGVA